MNRGCLFDSNIIIYSLNDRLDPLAERMVTKLLAGIRMWFSVLDAKGSEPCS
ncbi:MAG: hypothetical protein V1792_03510 [Pseudomonadota bacterium]